MDDCLSWILIGKCLYDYCILLLNYNINSYSESNQFENDDNNPILDRSSIGKALPTPEKEKDPFEYQEPITDVQYEPMAPMDDFQFQQEEMFEDTNNNKSARGGREDGNISKLSEVEELDVSILMWMKWLVVIVMCNKQIFDPNYKKSSHKNSEHAGDTSTDTVNYAMNPRTQKVMEIIQDQLMEEVCMFRIIIVVTYGVYLRL